MEIHAWTVNNEDRMLDLIGFGVDGITTDYPQILSDLLIGGSSLVTVPEPSARLLAIMGLLMAVASRERRSR